MFAGASREKANIIWFDVWACVILLDNKSPVGVASRPFFVNGGQDVFEDDPLQSISSGRNRIHHCTFGSVL